jgi:hypothetical protein
MVEMLEALLAIGGEGMVELTPESVQKIVEKLRYVEQLETALLLQKVDGKKVLTDCSSAVYLT